MYIIYLQSLNNIFLHICLFFNIMYLKKLYLQLIHQPLFGPTLHNCGPTADACLYVLFWFYKIFEHFALLKTMFHYKNVVFHVIK
jgi:hypothetical protein